MTGSEVEYPRLLRLVGSMYLEAPATAALERWHAALERAPEIAIVLRLREGVSAVDRDSASAVQELETEYARLFIGPAAVPCPPWESMYTSPNRQMMQQAYDAMEALYAQAGVAVNAVGVLPDHIGAELNFLALLLDRIQGSTGQAQQDAMVLADRLLDDHLNLWVPSFTTDLEKAARAPLYTALAQATRTVLRLLQE